MQYTFALAGNQNSGKTTLFNQLTGSNQHVGNWPGVTVEQKTGTMLHHHHGKQTHMGLPWRVRREQQEGKPVPDQYSDVTIVDLPGIYSLSPYSMEEIVSRNFIVRDQPDVVINIVDATNLERNLYLTLQLLELGRPVVVALNMMDEVRSHGDSIDLAGLEKGLGVPVVAICARKGEGIDELVSRAMEAAENKTVPPKLDICDGEAHTALHAIAHLVEDEAKEHHMQPRYIATKLFEGDKPLEEELGLSEETRHIIEEILSSMEKAVGMERAAVMADTRYRFIEKLLSTCFRRGQTEENTLTDRIDNVLTHPLLSIPVFLLMMFLVFFLTFGPVGSFFADGFALLIDSGVSRIVLPCFDNGTVYYYKDRYYSYSIGDLIEDDVAEEDAEFIREHGDNVDYYNMPLSDWQRYIRDNLRHMKTDDGNNISALEFAIESGIASDLWCFTDGKTAEIAKSVTDYIMRDSKNGLLIYYRRAINIEKIKFSEVEQSNIQSLQSLYYYCKDVLLPTEILRSSDICIGTSSVRLGDGFIRKAVCKKDGSSVCYMTTEKEKSEIGTLKCLSLSDIAKSEPTTVVDGITDFDVVGDAAISIDESKNLYYNSEKIAQSVDCWQSALDDSVVVFLADYNSGSGTGTLKSIENANVTTVAADIHDFAVYGGVVAYIGDYNKSEKKGTLYISSGIKAGKTTAIDASELIRY